MNYFFALPLKSRTVFGQQPSKTTFETPLFRAFSGDFRCEIKSPHPDKETKLEAQMADSSAICLFMRKNG